MIVAIAGLPGTGKTFLAEKLAARFGAPIFSTDRIRREINMEGRYDVRSKTAVYEALSKRLAASGSPLKLVDATLAQNAYRTILQQTADKAGEKLLYIETTASEDIVKKRISGKRKYSQADFPAYLKLKKEYEPIRQPRLTLDTGRGDQSAFEKAVQFIFKQQLAADG